MNFNDYRSKAKQHNRRIAWWIAALILGVVLVLILAIAIVVANRDLRPLAIACLVAYAIFFLVNLYSMERYFKKVPGLTCAHCDASLARSQAIILATGSCPSCGERVLDDHWVASRTRRHRSSGQSGEVQSMS
jgi:hypothetical protein